MKLKTAWWIMFLVYALDLLIITPYALWKYNVVEKGMLASWGFYKFGFWFFPVWGIIFGILLWLWLEFFFWVNLKLPSKYREIPKWIMVITWTGSMSYTIGHNLLVLRGIM